MRNFYALMLTLTSIVVSMNASAQGWTFLTSGTSENLNDMASSYSGGMIFVAVGDNGTIIRSTDNGDTWATIDAGVSENLNDIFYDGEMTTYMAVGNNGTIIYSEDEGLTWTAAATPPSDDLFGVTGTYGSTWYAVGTNMMVYRTSNSGVDWSPYTMGEGTGNLTAIAYDDYSGNPAVAGDGGYMAIWNGEGWDDHSTSGGEDIIGMHPDYAGYTVACVGGTIYYLETMAPAKTTATEYIHTTGLSEDVHGFASNGDGTWIAFGAAGTIFDMDNIDQTTQQPARKQFKSNSNINGGDVDGSTVYLVGDGGLAVRSSSWKNCDYTDVYVSSEDPTCYGGSDGTATVDSLPGWSGYSYYWETGATTSAISALSAGTVGVTITNDNQCTELAMVTITDPAMITVDAGADTDICYGASTSLSATGGATYSWSPGTGLSSTTVSNPTASPTDTTKYYVTVTDASGCSNVDSVTINVIPAPSYTLSNYYDICADDTAQVEISDYTGLEFTWETEVDLSDSTVADPELYPMYDQMFYVTITETATGCSTTDYADVYVTQRPDLDLLDDTICNGQSAFIIAEEEQPAKTGNISFFEYTWSTGESGTSIEVTEEGEYSVVGYSPEVGCPSYDTMYLTVIDPKPVLVDTGFCAGSGITLDPGTFEGYLWSTGETTATIDVGTASEYSVTVSEWECTGIDTGNVVSLTQPTVTLNNDSTCDDDLMVTATEGSAFIWSTGETSASIILSTSGTYHVTVAEGDCWDRDTMEFTRHPAVDLQIDNDTICEGMFGMLDAGPGYVSYDWQFTGTTQVISGLTEGTYNVDVVDANGCGGSASPEVVVNPLPTFDLGNDAVICEGDPFELPGPIGTLSYLWNNGSTIRNPIVSTGGEYILTVTSAGGCIFQDTVNVTANPLPAPALDGVDICDGTTATITPGPGYSSYAWNTDEITETIEVSIGGQYWVEVSNEFGCYNADTMQLGIIIPAEGVMKDTAVCQDASVQICPGNFDQYLWFDGSTTKTVDVPATGDGTYNVTVTDINDCQVPGYVNVIVAPTIALTVDSVDALCAGSANGSANAVAMGGMGPLHYMWSNSATTAMINNLLAGPYQVTVTDSLGCASSDQTLVQEPAPMGVLFSADSAVCQAPNGTASATALGGVPGYSFAWSNGAMTQSIIDLAPGWYSVQIMDDNGCLFQDSVKVGVVDSVLTVDVSTEPAVCATGGSAGVVVSGGVGPYAYNWANGATDDNISGVSSATHDVSITDANGCMTITGAQVAQADSTLGYTTSTAPVICTTGGQAGVEVSGGVEPYSYNWTTGASTASIGNVTTDSYGVTVTDANGCSTVAMIDVEQADSTLAISFDVVDAVCANNAGQATANISGGAEPYDINWLDGGNQATISDLAAGYALIAVTDANGCYVLDSALVGQSDSTLTLTLDSVNTVCTNNIGEVSAAAAGGVEPYTYNWSDDGEGATQTNLNADVYSVTVVDANGCIITGMTTVGIDTEELVVGITSINTICDGLHGSVNTAVSGGTPDYTYAWSNGETTANISSVGVGTYSVTATDANGCKGSNDIEVEDEPEAIDIAFEVTSSSCNQSDGGIEATVTGTTGDVQFSWPEAGGSTSTVSAIPAGTYHVIVVDSLGCTDSSSVVINDLDGPSVTLDSVVNAECSQPDGAIYITATGGTGDLTYAWSNGKATEDVTNLLPGQFSVEVSDINGCIGGVSAKVVTNGNVAPVVEGTVTSSLNGDTINQAKVTMIQFSTAPGTLPKFVSKSLDENGFFRFEDVWVDDYIVLVTPDTNFFPNAFKTFFPNVPRWDSAQVVGTSCADTTVLEISVRQFFAMNGKGRIRGQIIQQLKDILFKTGEVTGDPIPGINVSLEQVPGGIVAQTETDEDGIYLFDNVPAGDYQIFVDIPGLPMDSTYNVTIAESDEDTTVVDLDFFVDSTQSVYIDPVIKDAIYEVALEGANIVAYPNPFKSSFEMAMQFAEPGSEVVIALRDVTGRVVEQKAFTAIQQQTVSFQHLENLEPGMWMVQGTVDGAGFAIPLVKMK